MKRYFLIFIFTCLLFPWSISAQTPNPTFAPFTNAPWPHPFNYPCTSTNLPRDFHPLRPYPGNPCDPLIPQKTPEAPQATKPFKSYMTYNCNPSLNVSGTYNVKDIVDLCGVFVLPNPLNVYSLTYDENGDSPNFLCTPTGGDICFVKRVVWFVMMDLTNAKLPFMGNTEMTLPDNTKTNEFMDWYLNGTIYQSEKKFLNPIVPADVKRITDSSGPINKMIPKDLRDTIKAKVTTKNYGLFYQYHDYLVGGGTNWRLHNARTTGLVYPWIWRFVNYSTLEDTTSEVNMSVIPEAQPTSPEIDGQILAIRLIVSQGTDSRVYFSHMKSIVALSQLLNAFHTPITTPFPTHFPPTPPPPRPPNTTPPFVYSPTWVSQQVKRHQGLSDGGIIEGEDVENPGIPVMDPSQIRWLYTHDRLIRNTEMAEGSLAPAALYTPVPDNWRCDPMITKNNPGDSLLGHKLSGTLTYYQLFRWTPTRLVACVGPGGSRCPAGSPDVCTNTTTSPGCVTPQCSGEKAVCGSKDTCSLQGCCWGVCPYLSPCQHADANFYCVPATNGCGHNADSGDEPKNYSCSPAHPGWACCGPGPITRCVLTPSAPVGTMCSGDTQAECEAIFGCHFSSTPYREKPNPPHCPAWPTIDLKSGARVNPYIKNPLIELIYNLLVVNPESLLHRWLPKIPLSDTDTNSIKIGRDATIPAREPVPYYASSSNLDNTQYSGGLGGGGGLLFTHFGSLSDYILGRANSENYNLQRMLRPWTPTNWTSNSVGNGTINCIKNVPVNPAALGLCSVDVFADVALRWAGSGVNYAKECYGDVVARAAKAGVDVGFALWIWLHESAASNYIAYPGVQDFGINGGGVPAMDFSAQLDFFLRLPDTYAARCGKRDMHTFVSEFYMGVCDSSDPRVIEYEQTIKDTWNMVSCGRPLPTYP